MIMIVDICVYDVHIVSLRLFIIIFFILLLVMILYSTILLLLLFSRSSPSPWVRIEKMNSRELQAPWPSSCEASVFVRGACFAFSALFQLIGATEELGYKRHITISLDPMCCKDLQAVDTNRSIMISLHTLWWIAQVATSFNLLFVQPIFLQSYSDYCGVLFEWFFRYDRYHIYRHRYVHTYSITRSSISRILWLTFWREAWFWCCFL